MIHFVISCGLFYIGFWVCFAMFGALCLLTEYLYEQVCANKLFLTIVAVLVVVVIQNWSWMAGHMDEFIGFFLFVFGFVGVLSVMDDESAPSVRKKSK